MSKDITYLNKLVRDRIPDNLANEGKRAVLTIVTGEELLQAMRRKIIEEANELATAEGKDKITEEIGDLLEIIAAYRNACDVTAHDVQAVMMRKTSKSGNFTQGRFLISISEETIPEMVRRHP
jgi:predicted house-cleaning noncanonical NTP pyrophosphatase (MazG superfamily)